MGAPPTAAPAPMDPLKNGLAVGYTLEPLHEGAQKVYASNVYKIKNSSGAVRGIRKVVYAHTPGLFAPTRKEQDIYTTLARIPGHEQYILPYKQGKQNAGSVYINFNWKDGSDLIDYLEPRMTSISAEEKRGIIVRAATALKWLAEQGYLHGDMKFQNLYRDTAGNIYLLDFGSASQIARAQDSEIEREIKRFIEMVTALVPESASQLKADILKVAAFNLEAYDDYRNAIVPFYNFVIDTVKGGQTGGRRYRRKTHRRHRKSRTVRRRKI